MKFTTPRLNIHQNAAELMQQSPLVYPMLYASSFNTLNKSGYTNVAKVESRTSSLVLSRCGNVTEQVTQTLNYLPYGEDWVDIQNFAETQYPRLGIYSFNGKEKDYESGYHYYGARYYWSELLTGWLSVDPMMDKYPDISPYNYCAWNPVNVVDPNGMDTIDIKYNTTNNKWEIGTPVIAEGNDVFNVTGSDGVTTPYTFSEGTYGKRMNVILLEEDFVLDANGKPIVDESFGVYHLSGKEETGFVLQPSSKTTTGHNYNYGEYTTYIGKGAHWFNYVGLLLKGTTNKDGVRIHYGKGRSWSTGCLILSSEYSYNGVSKPRSFDLNKSQEAAWIWAQYAGATSRENKPMDGANRYRDWYTYGTFTAPTVTIKKY